MSRKQKTHCSGSAAAAFVLLLVLLAVFLALALPGAKLESNVLTLLPMRSLEGLPAEITQGVYSRLDRQLVFLVKPGSSGSRVADLLYEQLSSDNLIATVSGRVDAQTEEQLGRFWFDNSTAFIDGATRQRLEDGGKEQADFVLSQLFGAFAGVSSYEFVLDPFLLARSERFALGPLLPRFKDGYPGVEDGEDFWYFIHAQSTASAFAFTEGRQLEERIDAYIRKVTEQDPGAQVLKRGALFYSTYAGKSAGHDLKYLGTCTIVGVLVLFLVVFRSLRLLLLSAGSLAAGIICGTAALLLIFGEVHVITLVMAVSIIGIASDYTAYYLTRRLVHGAYEDAKTSLEQIRPALRLALLTTLAAYVLMLLLPFSGIRQIAAFALCGLVGACGFVVFLEPLLSGSIRSRPIPYGKMLDGILNAWTSRKLIYLGLPCVVLLVSGFGLSRLVIDDDISHLQAVSAELRTQDQRIAELLGQSADQKFFIVVADDDEALLQQWEELEPRLETAKQKGWLQKSRLFPLNSLKTQEQDFKLLLSARETMVSTLRQAGFDPGEIRLEARPLTAAEFLEGCGVQALTQLYLTAGGLHALVVPVSGVSNVQALRDLAAQCKGVWYLDSKSSFDEFFAWYREKLTLLIGGLLLIVLLFSVIRLGPVPGLAAFVPCLLSVIFALGVLGLCGRGLNLFAVLALILVTGIGINYTIFFSAAGGAPRTAFLANFLAMATTLLTLGMLVFSSTEAISSFGIVLASGIAAAFVLSPLALCKGKRADVKKPQPERRRMDRYI